MLLTTVILLAPTWYATKTLHQLAPSAHRPVYITNITQCKAYEVTDFYSLNTKKSKECGYLVRGAESPYDEDKKGPNRFAAGPQILQYYWPSRAPVVGDSSTTQRIFQIIHDPASYGPAPDDCCCEHLQPDHVFVLTGNVGFLIVEVQSLDGTFAGTFVVNKYDSRGAFIETSGPVRGKGDWKGIIDQAFPLRH